MGWLCKKTVGIFAKDGFNTKGYTAGPAAYAAGQVHKQGMLRVYGNFQRVKLLFQARRRCGIPQKQVG